MGKEHVQLRRHKIKTAGAESQEDSSFPADGQRAILMKKQKKKKKKKEAKSKSE